MTEPHQPEPRSERSGYLQSAEDPQPAYFQQPYQQQLRPPAYPPHGYGQSFPAQGNGYAGYGLSNEILASARPSGVVAAGIIAFLLGAAHAVYGIVAFGIGDGVAEFGVDMSGMFAAIGVVLLLLAALIIWGGAWAVSGKSYLLSAITSIVMAVLVLLGAISLMGEPGSGVSVVVAVIIVLLYGTIAALLFSAPSKEWFEAKRRV